MLVKTNGTGAQKFVSVKQLHRRIVFIDLKKRIGRVGHRLKQDESRLRFQDFFPIQGNKRINGIVSSFFRTRKNQFNPACLFRRDSKIFQSLFKT
ncbi:MAG: hypothetical protein GX382_05015 [Syntrophomonadaceae bacterium]|nr:hypothetical protein [Syntrophomonadaceae bacterium]